MMNKIVRTPTEAKGGITEDERRRMKAISDKWIATAFRTDAVDKAKITKAIHGLYAAAGLDKPRVVVAPSPLVMAYAYGAAAAIWYDRATTRNAIRRAINDPIDYDVHTATDYATRDATYFAAYRATRNAMNDATRAVNYDAIDLATDYSVRAATYDSVYRSAYVATDRAMDTTTENVLQNTTYYNVRETTLASTVNVIRRGIEHYTYRPVRRVTRDATDYSNYIAGAARACHDLAGNLGLECAEKWYVSYQGGAYWAGNCAYLEAVRDVLGLELPEFKQYQFWEDAASEAPFRIMHEKFCIVSDFPIQLKTDEENRPHCETGPSHLWRDGWALYYYHGVKVPARWVEEKDTIDPAEILKTQNVEQRAAGAALIGWPRMLAALDAKTIDKHDSDDIGELIEVTLPGLPKPGRFLKAYCPRNGVIVEGVPFVSDIDGLPIETALAAQAWRIGDPQSEYVHPPTRT